MKINKKEILQQQEYNRLYEVLDQDTQWGVEHIMGLEDKVKSLKRTINDFKLEITYYRNTIKSAETNLDVEICDWEFEDRTKTK